MEEVIQIIDKVKKGIRITNNDALLLYQEAPLAILGDVANFLRNQRTTPGIVTYLVDRNINYTNVCNSSCSFCAFYVYNSDDEKAYVLSKDVIKKKISEAQSWGASRILMQGGHNDQLDYEYYLDLVSWIKEYFPDIALNAFSPSEIHQMHLVSGKKYRDILLDLKERGLNGLPGGGAEILVDRVKDKISPKKISPQLWLDIMAIAQDLELTTSATMVIGCGESLEERIEHLDKIRTLQDRTRGNGKVGFSAFISWTMQLNKNTSLGRSRHRHRYGAGVIDYLKNVAMARIYLDNIVHHQASWPTLGEDIGKVALHFGCDDFGSTMMEENVVSQAGGYTKSKWAMTEEQLRDNIKEAGFIPKKRDSDYNIL